MNRNALRLAVLAFSLIAFSPGHLAAQGVLVPAGSNWKYFTGGIDPGAGWNSTNYNDSAWSGGATGVPAPLGQNSEGGLRTTIDIGPAANVYGAVFFRRTFVVNNPSDFVTLNSRLMRDDGAVVYLNGSVLVRDRVPEGTGILAVIGGGAVSGADETNFFAQPSQPATALRLGTNVLAAEVHQDNVGSSDLVFDFELRGTNAFPTVSLTSPANGASFNAGANINVAANANDLEGIASVEFFQNGNSIGSDTTAPYSVTWNNVADGSYALTAAVTDTDGAVVISAPINISVTDPTPPRLVNVLGTSNQVTVTFSKRVVPPSATTAGNYSINNGVLVSGASYGPSVNSNIIVLAVSPLTPNVTYTLIVNNVQDAAGQTIAANSQTNFVLGSFTATDVGSPTLAGSSAAAAGGINLSGAGTGISGTADQFQFSYQQFAGDFDVNVRLQGLSFADAWSKAGLMARESLTGGSRHASAFSTPTVSGTFFQWRATNNGATFSSGSFPATYPNTWLRLKRAGNLFTGYASIDGKSWSQLGTFTMSPGPAGPMFVGMAVSSQSPSQLATAEFRGFDNVVGNPPVGSPVFSREPLGPSSRRTGLVISEIMYHPREVDGLPGNLEFIELFNAQAIDENLGNFRISGAVDYKFAPNTIIKAGAFLVIARSPAAMHTHYGINGVLGPWVGAETNSLPGGQGTIRLRNPADAVMLEVNYEGGNPWPIAADGAGHSLVLTRPSYGERDPRAWAASDTIDGSPGKADPFSADPLSAVVINEFLAHTDPPLEDFIELYNHSNQEVDLSGAYLTDESDTNKFRITNGTTIAPRGFLAFKQTALGFALSADGERIYFVNPSQTRVIDAIEFGGQANGVSSGRSPDGSPMISPLATRTEGTANGVIKRSDIVINEIMYNPISGKDDDEYVELYNRGTAAVNIGGWRFTDGINFTFPDNTTIASNGYLVVARNLTNLLARYANLNAGNSVGDFGGGLANGGERIALAFPDYSVSTNTNTMVITTNVFYVDVNEVTYGDGGRWGDWSDGGGSSLELVDARTDTRFSANWADSDESAKGQWGNIEITGPLGETLSGSSSGAGTGPINDNLHVYLLGVGECLVDDVEVRMSNGANLIPNPDFQGGLTGWSLQGAFDQSTLEPVGFNSSQSLHMRAGARGDMGANRVRSPQFTTAVSGQSITLRAKARWIRGWPEILLRLHGGGLEVTGQLPLPGNLGTPGARNSRAVTNAGPAIYEVVHSSALPAANEAIVVTARAHDFDGLTSLTLKYRVDAVSPPSYTSAPMVDNGTSGDAVAGDGIYSATIAGRSTGTLVTFYVEAQDNATDRPKASNTFPQDLFPKPGLVRCFPNDAITRECVVRWGDPQMLGSFATYHLWVTLANVNRWNPGARDRLNNTPLDATFVYNNHRVIYNAKPQYGGSPWHRGSMQGPTNDNSRVDFVLSYPPDNKFLGAEDSVLNTPGNPGGNDSSDLSAQAEQASYIIFRELRIQYNYRRYFHFFVNGSHRSRSGNLAGNFIMEDSQQPNGDVVEQWSPDDADGDLYKIEDWFEFSNDTEAGYGFVINDADLTRRMTTLNGQSVLNIAPYRYMFRKRSVGPGDSASDYSSFQKLMDATSPLANPSASPIPDPGALNSIADIDQWMRIFACQHAIGNWDSYSYERGKNAYMYRGRNSDARFFQMTWDIDFTMGVGGRVPPVLFSSNDPRMSAIWATPIFRRSYLRAFQDMLDGPWNNSYMDPILDQKAAAFSNNQVSFTPSVVTTIKGYVTNTRNTLQNEVNTAAAGLNVAGTNSYSTSNNLITISGTAPVRIKDISINGILYPVTWTSVTGWTARVIASPGTNVFEVRGVNTYGEFTTNAARILTVVYTGAAAQPLGSIVFSEIMYNPLAPEASYVELLNTSDVSFDLTGFRVNGLDYTFPLGSIMTNRQSLVLAKNRAAVSSAFPGAATFDTFEGALDLDGETLTLFQPGANGNPDIVIDRVRYEARRPWGLAANGSGPSLQLIDAGEDNSRPSNWIDREEWRMVTFTGTIAGGASQGTNFLLFLNTIGDVYLDDIVLVTGTEAGVGENLLANGDFESPLTGPWVILGNHTNSVISTEFSRSGNASLHAIAAGPGSASSALRQIIPPFQANTVCTLSFWLKPSTNGTNVTLRTNPGSSFVSVNNFRPVPATPGFANSVVAPLPPYDPLWLNELQADNTSGPLDNVGQRDPWIELYNAGLAPIDLSPYYLANNYDTNLTQWPFPAGSSIAPGEFKVIWADGQPAQTSGANLHTSFRLNSTTGSVALVRIVNNSPQVTDYLTYAGLTPGYSYGDFPDGQPFTRQILREPSPGATNIARFVDLYINEWLAGNTNGLADPADGAFDDWFEIYNASSEAVDLGGYWLTDSPGSQGQYTMVPTNGQYIVPAGGYLLVWADNQTNQNSITRPDLHVRFQLGKSGDTIALYGPDRITVIDRIDFDGQTDDVTQGRFPDGTSTITALGMPTPRAANVLTAGNTAPTIATVGTRTATLGQPLSFTISATDAQASQTFTWSIVSGAPAGATLNSSSGLFSWNPAFTMVPTTNQVTVRVTDSGTPPLSDTETFTLLGLPPPTSITRAGNLITLQFQTIVGKTYRVEYKDDLNAGTWTPLAPGQVAVTTSRTVQDDMTGHPQRFYRIAQLD
jgi:hypothetical protein